MLDPSPRPREDARAKRQRWRERGLLVVALFAASWMVVGSARAAQPGADQPEGFDPSVATRRAVLSIERWLAAAPAGEASVAAWRAAVEEAPRTARLAAPLRTIAEVTDERIASLLAESPDEPPGWIESIGPAAPSLRLAIAERLYAERRHDACLAWTEGLSDAEVFAPALLHYLRAVALRQTVSDEAAAAALSDYEALAKDAEPDRLGAARRWVMTAMRREAERPGEELTHVARRMRDIERRLELGPSDESTPDRQKQVLKSLDELIEELEEQRRRQQQQAARGAGGADSSSPAEESRPSELKGPGEVDRKRLVAGDDWGALSPAERERLTQEIARDYPPHYRRLIEDYFRSLAEDEASDPSGDR